MVRNHRAHRHTAAFGPRVLLVTLLLAGCTLGPRPPAPPGRPAPEPLPDLGAESEGRPGPAPATPAATDTTRGIEETILEAEPPVAVPTPTPGGPGTITGALPDTPSVLTAIGPTTPPNVAAALRLVEDGRQQLAQGRYDVALDRFERSLTLDPNNPYAYYFLARLHFTTRRFDQAVTFAGRAVALGASLDPGWLGRTYELQGAAFEAVGRYADARAAYQNAIRTDPLNPAARAGWARLSPQ